MVGNRMGAPIRSMPDDFAEYVDKLSYKELRVRYKTGAGTISRWKGELTGAPVMRSRALPADFIAAAGTLSRPELMARYAVGERLLRKWINTTGVNPPIAKVTFKGRKALKPAPEDFREVGPTLTIKGMQRHYHAASETVHRWLKETGVVPAVYVAPPREKTKKAINWILPYRAAAPKRSDYGPHDEAADILRRHFPTYRCDDRGRQNSKGLFWRVGNAVVEPDELLTRAQRYRSKAA